jgi:pyroglutamyl-peptidase
MAGTLLLFAFEPFGGEARNPSGEIAAKLDGDVLGGCRIRSIVLPVARKLAFPAVERVFEESRPQIVVGLGVAAGRSVVSVERRAVNRDAYGGADELGERPEGEPIEPTGPHERLATVAVDELAAAIRRAGVPAETSDDAGTFLCNHVYYRVLGATSASGVPAVFLHLPALPETVAARGVASPSMALATTRRGVVAGVRFLARSTASVRGLKGR